MGHRDEQKTWLKVRAKIEGIGKVQQEEQKVRARLMIDYAASFVKILRRAY